MIFLAWDIPNFTSIPNGSPSRFATEGDHAGRPRRPLPLDSYSPQRTGCLRAQAILSISSAGLRAACRSNSRQKRTCFRSFFQNCCTRTGQGSPINSARTKHSTGCACTVPLAQLSSSLVRKAECSSATGDPMRRTLFVNTAGRASDEGGPI